MVRFKVEKMGCGGCAKSVTRAVHGVEPNAGVEVDLGVKLVTVSGATGPSERIVTAIAEAGYVAEPASGMAQQIGSFAVPDSAGRTSVPTRILAS